MNLTPFEQVLDADTSLVATDAFGPGIDVVLRAKDGTEHPVRAFFEQPWSDSAPGPAQARVISSIPMLHIQLSVIQHALGRPLNLHDRFIVRGVTYRPQSPVQDGYGLVPIKLQEIKDARP